MDTLSTPVADLSYPPEAQRWPPAFPPVCASTWGGDQYGLWIDVVIGGLVQRFRWIEPGEFVMGSPEDEEGRFDNEGPQHVVRLTEGFWLAETVSSQALWAAVRGGNPSKFQDNPQNPVERVSWDDVLGFLHQVEGLVPGVTVELLTEAEWEYACRAGRSAAFSWGESVEPEQANYDSSISYASGLTAEWRQKTLPVKSFVRNAWGLCQMHGNIWEWCADGPRDYDGRQQLNPRGEASDQAKAPRVVRGGSWFSGPLGLRAAYRAYGARDRRDDSLGFRFLLRTTSPGPERPPEALLTRDA